MRIRMGCLGWLILGPFILAGYAAYCAVMIIVWLLMAIAAGITAWSQRKDARSQTEPAAPPPRPKWPDIPWDGPASR